MKKTINFMMTMILTVSLCATSALFAADGDFIGTIDFTLGTMNWDDTANWAGGIVADGAGATAYITNGITPQPPTGNPKGILLAGDPTLEKLYFSLDNPGPSSASVILALGTLTLAGSPIVDVASMPNFYGGYIGAAGAAFGGVLAGTDGFTKTGDGKLYLQGDHTISGTLNQDAGTVWLDWPNAAQNLDIVVKDGAILTAAFTTNNVNSITVNGGGKLETYNIPSTILSPSITIKPNGYLNIANEANVEISGSAVTVENGGSVYCDVGQTFVVNNDITLEGNGHQGGAIEIFNTVANGTYNGTMTMTGNTRIFSHGATDTMTFNGPFTGIGALEFIGQGGAPGHTHFFNLNAQNVHNGMTSLRTFASDTTFEINVNNCFNTSQPLEFYVHNWGANYMRIFVDLNDYTQTASSLNIFCGTAGDYVQLLGNAGSKLSISGNVNQSGGTAEVTTCELEIGGVLTVDGTLIGMNNVTLLPGASISGAGSVDALTIPSGVTVAPGSSIGTLNTGALTMDTGSEYDWEVGDPVSADLINVAGTLDVSGGITVNVIDAGTPDGSAYTLFTTTGIVGDAADITMNYGLGIAGPVNPTIIGNDIVANIIPEPATLGLLAILGLAFLRRK